MTTKPAQSLTNHFATLQDPRTGNAKQHELLDSIIIALCATICGADTGVAIAVWGKANRKWVWRLLALPNGIPSHDTFRRVWILLEPKHFRQCFLQGVRSVSQLTHGQSVAMDGKKLRRSHHLGSGQKALPMVVSSLDNKKSNPRRTK